LYRDRSSTSPSSFGGGARLGERRGRATPAAAPPLVRKTVAPGWGDKPPLGAAPEFAQDARVLNSISGHADSATREQVYQDRENERVRAHAATARRSMRRYLLEGTDGEEIAT
jgi:hypothetical protein